VAIDTRMFEIDSSSTIGADDDLELQKLTQLN